VTLEPAIYRGALRHRRFQPTQHEFTYPVFMVFLNVDTIAETMQGVRFGGYNRFNWASFQERDHFGDPSLSLRARLERDASAQGIALPDGPIYLLTNLRYLGYCFNPISIFFCYPRAGGAPMVVAEVNNTFGETKLYWLGPHNAVPAQNSLHFRCAKDLHVSPFMDMALDYDFVLTEPAERLVVQINTLEGGHSFFDATLTMQREDWTSANLTASLMRQPWLTAKIIAAIHWEAVRLWWKGTPFFPHPASKPIPGEAPR